MVQRSEWIDYTKALGIMLVVYAHVARGLYNAGVAIPKSFFELTDSVIYSFVMPLFFFLSGLFFYSSFSKRGATGLLAPLAAVWLIERYRILYVFSAPISRWLGGKSVRLK